MTYPSYYHTTAQLNEALEQLQSTCKHNFELKTIVENPKVYVVTISSDKATEKVQKNFLLFGEHARELISPETGLNLIRGLCGKTSINGIDTDKLLEKHSYQIILNSNPSGRVAVENGEYCKRTNENDVDLNRNWDDHWKADGTGDTYPGPRPFSELESTAVKNAMAQFKPDVFITIHSGTMALFTPFAYSTTEPQKNENLMLEVLSEINPKYCNCEQGAAGAEVGYLSPGTCLDYAYDKLKVPYTFAIEIFSSQMDIPRNSKSASFLQMNSKAKMQERQDIAKKHSCFAQTAVKLSNDQCFYFFNPDSETQYRSYIENWSEALIEMTTLVHDKTQSL